MRWEHLDQAVDALGRVGRRQRRQHEHAGLRGLQRRPRSGGVVELPDHHDVRILAQRVHETGVEALRVGAHLALVDDGELVRVQHLHRVLDRHDVAGARRVDPIDHRRQRRRLPRAGEAGHEQQTLTPVHERTHRRRERQRLEAGNAREHPPQNQADEATLAEGVHPEPAEPGDAVREVGLVRGPERGGSGRGHDPGGEAVGVGRLDGVERRLAQAAVDAQPWPRADLDVDVGCAVLDGEPQQLVEIQHGRPPGTVSTTGESA